MADEVIQPTVQPVEAAPVEVAPVVEANTPVTEAAPVEAPVTEAPVEVAPAAEEAKPAETVLGEALEKTEPPKEEVKAEEAKTEEAQPQENTTEEGQSEEPAPPPVYEDFKAPEGVTLDAEQVKEFTNLLSDLELSGKIPHELVQEHGQKLVDFHVAQMQKATEDLAKFYQTTWEKQKTDWKESFLKDPDIGGNRFQTTVDSALTFIRTHGGTPDQQAEFRQLMETSGLGNHPAMIRLLANAGRAMSEGRPLAAQAPPPQPKSKINTMYGKNS